MLTVFPDGRRHADTEKLYADVTPLVPFMPWLVED